MSNINELISLISETQQYFKQQAERQVNTALTLRNWLFGFYLAEYELNGSDRAKYGQGVFKEIAVQLENGGVKQIRERHLYLCKDFICPILTFCRRRPQNLITPSSTLKMYYSLCKKMKIL